MQENFEKCKKNWTALRDSNAKLINQINDCLQSDEVNFITLEELINQGSYALKPGPYFCRTLLPKHQKDNFLSNEFTTYYLENHFMLLVVVESYKNGSVA